MGKPPLLLTVVLLRVLWFLPTNPLLGGVCPHDLGSDNFNPVYTSVKITPILQR